MVTKTWNGGNADWFTSANWTGGSIPGAGDDAVINSGVVSATGGDPAISVNSISLNSSGTLVLANGAISGGSLTTTGSGTIETLNGTADTLNGVSITSGSTFTIGDSSTAIFENTITNQGTILLNATGAVTTLQLGDPSVTLTGGGTLQSSNNINNRILDPAGSATLINVNNTIEGTWTFGNGQISLDNQSGGTIDAIYAQTGKHTHDHDHC